MALAKNMSVTEERPQAIHPGERANRLPASVALPRRCRSGWDWGLRANTTANRANTVKEAARAAGKRAAHSVIPKARKLIATIQ